MFPRQEKAFYALIPLIFLAGCATYDDPKDYQPSTSSSDTGRVCLYRTAPRITPGAWRDWILDGRWRGEIRPDRFYCKDFHVGRHVVRVAGENEKLEFTLEKDQQVFIRFEADRGLFGKGIYPILVDQQTAREELKSRGYDIDRPGTAP